MTHGNRDPVSGGDGGEFHNIDSRIRGTLDSGLSTRHFGRSVKAGEGPYRLTLPSTVVTSVYTCKVKIFSLEVTFLVRGPLTMYVSCEFSLMLNNWRPLFSKELLNDL